LAQETLPANCGNLVKPLKAAFESQIAEKAGERKF